MCCRRNLIPVNIWLTLRLSIKDIAVNAANCAVVSIGLLNIFFMEFMVRG